MENKTVRRFASCALALGLVAAQAGVARAQDPATPPPAETPPADAPPDVAPVEAPVAEPTPPVVEAKKSEASPISASYDKGVKLVSEDGEFELKLALRTQFRYDLKPTEDDSEIAQHVTIPRARLQLEGHVFGEDHRYKLEFAMGDKTGFAFVKDLYIEQAFSDGKVALRVGQWKQPFNRQEIVSDFGSEFNERANTAEFVEGGRDLGIAFHNNYEKSPEGIEWAVGLFNSFKAGTDKPAIPVKCTQDAVTMAITCAGGTPGSAPADWQPALVLRVGWNSGKIKGYSEGDLEGGPLRFAVAASYKVDLAELEKGGEESVADNMQHGVGVDGIVKIEGFDLLLGVFMMKARGADSEAELGANVQAGFFLTPKKVQVAARFSFVPTAADPDRKNLEIRGAFNYYFHGHSWKWATDFGITQTTGEDEDGVADKANVEVRSMAQLTF